MRLAAKRDSCEPAIVDALEAAGYAVQRLSEPGVPDLLVCNPRIGLGRLYLLEVKVPGEKLTPAQARWHAKWPGRVAIVHNEHEAIEACK